MTDEYEEKVNACIKAEEELYGRTVLASESIVVALYELGRIARALLYARSSLEKKEVASYCSEVCIDLGDLITQALMIFQKIRGHTKSYSDVSSEQLILDGLERQQDRMKEHKMAGFNKEINL